GARTATAAGAPHGARLRQARTLKPATEPAPSQRSVSVGTA
ncbi:hypothetical protein HMPREF0591_3035, partial [Mycobacterium parascrofulaceum ATCC BAA-614]